MNNNRVEKLLSENSSESPSNILLNYDRSVVLSKNDDYEYKVQVGCFPDTDCGRRSKWVFTVVAAIILIVLGLIAVVFLYNFFTCLAQINDSDSNNKQTLE